MDLLNKLHEFWISEKNSDRGSRAKLFLGRESHASAGVIAGFAPTGVMAMHKVMLTVESPQDAADAVLACKVRPNQGEATSMLGRAVYGVSITLEQACTSPNHSCFYWANPYVVTNMYECRI